MTIKSHLRALPLWAFCLSFGCGNSGQSIDKQPPRKNSNHIVCLVSKKSKIPFPFIEIRKGEVNISNDTIEAIMTIANIPDSIHYNNESLKDGKTEYYWAVYLKGKSPDGKEHEITADIMHGHYSAQETEKYQVNMVSSYNYFFKKCRRQAYIRVDSATLIPLLGTQFSWTRNEIKFKIPYKGLSDSIRIDSTSAVLFYSTYKDHSNGNVDGTNYRNQLTNDSKSFSEKWKW